MHRLLKEHICHLCVYATVFSGVRVAISLAFSVAFCRPLFLLFFFDLRLLITTLVSKIYDFWLPLWYLRFTTSDYHFGILDLRLLITTLVSKSILSFLDDRIHIYLMISEKFEIYIYIYMSIPTTLRHFLVLTSAQIGRRLPVFTLLLWQRQHIIVVDAVDYK